MAQITWFWLSQMTKSKSYLPFSRKNNLSHSDGKVTHRKARNENIQNGDEKKIPTNWYYFSKILKKIKIKIKLTIPLLNIEKIPMFQIVLKMFARQQTHPIVQGFFYFDFIIIASMWWAAPTIIPDLGGWSTQCGVWIQ